MIGRMIDRVGRQVAQARERTVFLFFLAGSFFIRLPFFFRDYIDRDESTFILVAQSLVEGHLPYTELWDLKPPLVFFIFALPIWVFGKSFVAIRMIGLAAVGVISYYTYRLGRESGDKQSGFAAGLLCMFLMSLFGSVQGVMSEHLSMAFLLPGAFLLIHRKSGTACFLAGVLMGFAVLAKSNLGIALLVAGIYLVYNTRKESEHAGWARIGWVVCGGTATILLTLLPYLAEGLAHLWWDAVVRAPLAYSGRQEGFAIGHLPFYGGVALLFWFGWRRRWLDLTKPGNGWVLALLTGTLLSFITGGKLNGHYLLQFYPLFLVLLFGGLQRRLPGVPRAVGGMALMLLLILPVESYLEYGAVASNYRRTGSLLNGEGVEVPRYLNQAPDPPGRVLFLEYHIGYWLLGSQPPSPAATHPSNICRPALFPYMPGHRQTTEEELHYLLEVYRPEFVVTRKGKSIFNRGFEAANASVRSYLQVYYRRDTLIGRAEIYKRL